MTFKKSGLVIKQEGKKVFRIFSGQDIDRQLRIQEMRDKRNFDKETQKRKQEGGGV